MKILKHLPLVAFLGLMALSHQAGAIESFREWKSGQIQDAQIKIANLRSQIEWRKQQVKPLRRDPAQGQDPNLQKTKAITEANAGADAQVEKMQRQLQQELYDLDLAKDLTVSDYFAGYLIKMQDKKTAFTEVAGKLSPEEVAELMNAYANSVFGSHAADIPASAGNVTRDSVK